MNEVSAEVIGFLELCARMSKLSETTNVSGIAFVIGDKTTSATSKKFSSKQSAMMKAMKEIKQENAAAAVIENCSQDFMMSSGKTVFCFQSTIGR